MSLYRFRNPYGKQSMPLTADEIFKLFPELNFGDLPIGKEIVQIERGENCGYTFTKEEI